VSERERARARERERERASERERFIDKERERERASEKESERQRERERARASERTSERERPCMCKFIYVCVRAWVLACVRVHAPLSLSRARAPRGGVTRQGVEMTESWVSKKLPLSVLSLLLARVPDTESGLF
jgi:hypothetical protein